MVYSAKLMGRGEKKRGDDEVGLNRRNLVICRTRLKRAALLPFGKIRFTPQARRFPACRPGPDIICEKPESKNIHDGKNYVINRNVLLIVHAPMGAHDKDFSIDYLGFCRTKTGVRPTMMG